MSYICETCHKVFKQKGPFDNHKCIPSNEIANQLNGVDLFMTYKNDLSNILTSEELKLFESTYKVSNIENVDVYTQVYCSIMKQRDRVGEDMTLFEKITRDDKIKVLWGNCLDSLKKLPTESIGLMVTSPPYYKAL
jgi:hypothetical protein